MNELDNELDRILFGVMIDEQFDIQRILTNLNMNLMGAELRLSNSEAIDKIKDLFKGFDKSKVYSYLDSKGITFHGMDTFPTQAVNYIELDESS